jgi:hypothetical protein
MYKVFVNQSLIVLTSQIPFGSKINIYSLKEISIDIIIIKAKKHKRIFLYHKKPKKLLPLFLKKIKVIKAGGGIVKNSLNQILFIYRRNKWDLPKGKMDAGESIDQTAIREVLEETGAKGLEIINLNAVTYHVFKNDNKFFLKETTWYNMKANNSSNLIPEEKEGITKVVWKNKAEILNKKNIYPNIKLLLDI